MPRINKPNKTTPVGADEFLIYDSEDTSDDKNITLTQVQSFVLDNGDGSTLTSLDADNISSGSLDDARLSTNVTLQGNTFNGNDQLVQLNSTGQLPALDGSLLTNIIPQDTIINFNTVSTGTITLTEDKFHIVTFSGASTIALPTGLTSGIHYNCSLLITMDSIVTITQPTVTWVYGVIPSLTSTSVKYRLTYETTDGGTTWYGYWTQLGA